jgi:hypothetical protein
LGLISEIGDLARFSNPRELGSWLGITPSEYSSGDQQHRGHITKARNRHARRLLVEAAWHYRHTPRRPAAGPQPNERAWQAQVRLHHRYRHLTDHGKRSTIVNVAIARGELVGFLWAAMTDQPLTIRNQPQGDRRLANPHPGESGRPVRAARRTLDRSMRARLATLVKSEAAHDRTLSCGPDPRIFRVTELAQVLPTPSHFEQACELVTPDLLSPPMGPDLDAHAATLQEDADAGVDELFVQQIGPEQDAFFTTWAKEILPRF